MFSMNYIYAYLTASAYAYLACAVYTVLGYPPLRDMTKINQLIFYVAAFGVFNAVIALPCPSLVYYVLGAFYGFAALGSFIGYPQRWMAYWLPVPEEGSAAGQTMMACWDLGIAVAFLLLA